MNICNEARARAAAGLGGEGGLLAELEYSTDDITYNILYIHGYEYM